MTDLQDQLAQIRERAEKAEPYAEERDAGYPTHSEAVILRSQADVLPLLEAVEAVIETIEKYPEPTTRDDPTGEIAFEISAIGDTIRDTLTAKLTGEDDE